MYFDPSTLAAVHHELLFPTFFSTFCGLFDVSSVDSDTQSLLDLLLHFEYGGRIDRGNHVLVMSGDASGFEHSVSPCFAIYIWLIWPELLPDVESVDRFHRAHGPDHPYRN